MDIHGIIAGANKSGGYGPRADFWYPKTDGTYPLRLYRFEVDGKKELFSTRAIHRPDWKQPPMPCMGEECQLCDSVKRLYEAGDKDSKDKAYKLKAEYPMTFVAVLENEPNGFRIWETAARDGQNIILQIAMVAGWTQGWPKPDQTELCAQFAELVDRGLAECCGPNAYSLLVNYQKGRKPATQLTFSRVKGKVLTQAEDASVPNPTAIRARIEQRMAEKAGVVKN